MNALFRWLALPWYAAPRVLRVFIFVTAGLFWAGMAASALFANGTRMLGAEAALVLAWFAAYFWWMFIGSRSVLILQDAWHLRLPRTLARSLALLTSALTQTVLLPALVVTLAGVSAPTALILLLAVACVTLAYSVLPPRAGLPALMLLMVLVIGNTSLGLPAIGSAALSIMAASVAALAVLVFVFSVRRLIWKAPPAGGFWRTPQVTTMRRQLGLQGGLIQAWQEMPGNDRDHGRMLPVEPMSPHTDGHVGQADATRAIRVMLGPPYAPQRLRRAARPWLLALLVGALIELLAAHFLPAMLVLRVNVIVLIWLVVLGLWFAPGVASTPLRRVFVRGTTAELPLLALLPGLGDAATRRRSLLRATLLPVLRVWGGITAIIAIAWLLLVGKAIVIPGLLLLAALGATLTSAVVLAVLNGRDLQDASLTRKMLGAILVGVYLLLIVAFLLAVLPFALSVATQQPLPDGWQAQQFWIALAVAVIWLGTLMVSAASLRRQWRSFMRRPHPFMQR